MGPDHPDVGVSLNNLAQVYVAQGRFAEAEPFLKRSLSICEKALCPDHPYVARSLNGLAALYRQTGRADAAATLEARIKQIPPLVRGTYMSILLPTASVALTTLTQGSLHSAAKRAILHLAKPSCAFPKANSGS